MICCPLDGGDDAPAAVVAVRVVQARKDHSCSECAEVITRGSKYERVNGMWDRAWSTFRTCLSCVEIRDHFSCEGSGWIYSELWSQLEEFFFPDMKAGGPCMEGLSPAAKGRLFERRLKWLEERGRE